MRAGPPRGGAASRAVDPARLLLDVAARGVGDVAFVDVPGHERFIATTLGGVGPVPVVMFVVAADDPWMPQAAEHLAALRRAGRLARSAGGHPLGPRRPRSGSGTRPRRAGGHDVGGRPPSPCSGRTGDGLDELRRMLAEVLARRPHPIRPPTCGCGSTAGSTSAAPARWSPARSRRARSTVGDVLEVAVHRCACADSRRSERPVDRRHGVARVAIAVGGRAPARLSRAALVAPRARSSTPTWSTCGSAGEGPPPERPMLHIGSAAVAVHARPLADDLARLTAAGALPLRVGDRAILRDPGSRRSGASTSSTRCHRSWTGGVRPPPERPSSMALTAHRRHTSPCGASYVAPSCAASDSPWMTCRSVP